MTTAEETYIHFVNCIDDLGRAWSLLHEIRASHASSLRLPAFQFAIVEYAKAYRSARGALSSRHKLDDECVPPTQRDLHGRLLSARDQFHAHSDLTLRDARLRVSDAGGQRHAYRVQNVVTGAEELPHVDSIIELIEQTLDCMYVEARRLESLLPITA